MGAVVMGGYLLGMLGFLLGDKGLFVLGAVLFVGGIGHLNLVNTEGDE